MKFDDIIDLDPETGQYLGGANNAKNKDRTSIQTRRRQIIQGVIEGKTPKEAAIDAGYAESGAGQTARDVMRSPEAKLMFHEILDRKGLTDDRLADKCAELLESEKVSFAQKDGIYTDERSQPDHDIQRKTLQMILQVKGHLSADNTTINIDNSKNLIATVIQAMKIEKQSE